MGNKIQRHEQCYVNECNDEALLFIDRMFYDDNCNMCIKQPRIKTCHRHKIGHYYICPKKKVIRSNYYYKDMLVAHNDRINLIDPDYNPLLYRIGEDYVYDYGNYTYPPFRFKQQKHNCSNVYLKEPCFSDESLYDLTPKYTLEELRRNDQYYVNILPRDIYDIISGLIKNSRFFN